MGGRPRSAGAITLQAEGLDVIGGQKFHASYMLKNRKNEYWPLENFKLKMRDGPALEIKMLYLNLTTYWNKKMASKGVTFTRV